MVHHQKFLGNYIRVCSLCRGLHKLHFTKNTLKNISHNKTHTHTFLCANLETFRWEFYEFTYFDYVRKHRWLAPLYVFWEIQFVHIQEGFFLVPMQYMYVECRWSQSGNTFFSLERTTTKRKILYFLISRRYKDILGVVQSLHSSQYSRQQ